MTTSTLTLPTLVLGANGKTGRRVTRLLAGLDRPVRPASRTSQHPFDWFDESTWKAALGGVGGVYVVPLTDPASATRTSRFVELAAASGVQRLVLLSGRGVGKPERTAPVYQGSLQIEQAVRATAVEWTILRPSWFAQNLSEDFLLDGVLSGELRVPAGDGGEAFVDVDDVADVAVAALTDDRHVGQTYELSGADVLTFSDVAELVSRATRRRITYVPVPPDEYVGELVAYGLDEGFAQALGELFAVIREGRSAYVSDGVEQALGRPPRAVADYVRATARMAVWTP